jgi:hypothetical protein
MRTYHTPRLGAERIENQRGSQISEVAMLRAHRVDALNSSTTIRVLEADGHQLQLGVDTSRWAAIVSASGSSRPNAVIDASYQMGLNPPRSNGSRSQLGAARTSRGVLPVQRLKACVNALTS